MSTDVGRGMHDHLGVVAPKQVQQDVNWWGNFTFNILSLFCYGSLKVLKRGERHGDSGDRLGGSEHVFFSPTAPLHLPLRRVIFFFSTTVQEHLTSHFKHILP
jgi:hypothetical protein